MFNNFFLVTVDEEPAMKTRRIDANTEKGNKISFTFYFKSILVYHVKRMMIQKYFVKPFFVVTVAQVQPQVNHTATETRADAADAETGNIFFYFLL